MRGDKLVIHDEHRLAAHKLLLLLSPYITRAENSFIITIAGESGSGKSEVAAVLVQLLLETRHIKSIILQQDDYFVYPPKTNAEMRKKDIRHVGLSEVRLDELDQNCADIMQGKKEIHKPLVIFDEDRITQETVHLEGIRVVIVEGTYTTLLKNVQQHIFIDRTYRDTRSRRKERAREEQDALLEQILEIEHNVIKQHKAYADIVITRTYDVVKTERSEDGFD